MPPKRALELAYDKVAATTVRLRFGAGHWPAASRLGRGPWPRQRGGSDGAVHRDGHRRRLYQRRRRTRCPSAFLSRCGGHSLGNTGLYHVPDTAPVCVAAHDLCGLVRACRDQAALAQPRAGSAVDCVTSFTAFTVLDTLGEHTDVPYPALFQNTFHHLGRPDCGQPDHGRADHAGFGRY